MIGLQSPRQDSWKFRCFSYKVATRLIKTQSPGIRDGTLKPLEIAGDKNHY
jgi:hypothetical protein